MNRILYEYGSLGVNKCRRMLKSRYGADLTKSAVQRHASRIGASLAVVRTCPRCGLTAPKSEFVGGTQLCRECHMGYLADKERARAKVDESAVQSKRREYNALRRANERARGTDGK